MENLPEPADPQAVYLGRPVTPTKQAISGELKAKNQASRQRYPTLNLSESEYIIDEVRRHPIGLIVPVSLTIILVAAVMSVIFSYPQLLAGLGIPSAPPFSIVALIGGLLALLCLVGGYISVWVYTNNKFFLTNESVIQELQTSLFARQEQTVSLANIEDASFQQKGILQTLFNYGSIRLSTEGDETTYRFYYVADPKQQIATLNNAIEAFKNGRPVEES